jgi:uncharacterized protein
VRWLRQHLDSVVPPMSLQELVAQTELPADAAAAIDSLVTLKAVTREMGTSQVPQALRAFILGELADADWFWTERSEQDTEAARRHAAGFFRKAVNTYGPRP